MREQQLTDYHDSLALWAGKFTLGEQATLMALWHHPPNPALEAPKVKVSQAALASMIGLKVETVRKNLRELEKRGAIRRLRHSERAHPHAYQLHHHPNAATQRRSYRDGADESTGDKHTARTPKLRRPGPPPGVKRSDIAAVLETLPGVRSNLPYSGRGAWQVNDAIEAMHAAGWDLAEFEHAVASYAADPREDKPPPDKLFSGKERTHDAIERYGPKSEAATPSQVEPTPTRAQWIDYLERWTTRERAHELMTQHGETITTMGVDGIKSAIMAWQSRRDGSDLASIFAGEQP